MRYPFSILRSPGSKSWFVPIAEHFVRAQGQLETIVEPFAGGGVVSLTLLNRGYGRRVVLAEKDPELRRFWEIALNDAELATRVITWTHNLRAMPEERQAKFVIESLEQMQVADPAFFVLLRSRRSFNSILQGHHSFRAVRPVRHWWPNTLGYSLRFLYNAREKIEVLSEALDALNRTDRPDSYAFVDPPYTCGRNSPGHALYRESEVDHQALLYRLANWKGAFQLTSEYCSEILRLLTRAGLGSGRVTRYVVPMRTGHAQQKVELVVNRKPVNCRNAGS
jgi:DNA adenine methylase